jgi:hypothetical protein
VNYAYLPQLTFTGNAGYRQYEYAFAGTTTQAPGTASISSTSLAVGAQYQQVFSPEQLDPFSLLTGYRFFLGYSDVADSSSSSTAMTPGSGFYYTNALDLGLHSTRWKHESLNFDYSYYSLRDNSLMNADQLTQTSRATFVTNRVPNTGISANMYYITQETDNGQRFPAVISTTSANLQTNTRSMGYGAAVDHRVNSFLNVNAGASQGQSTTSTVYTLATVTSIYETRERMLYAGANLSYGLAQNLTGRASFREERRTVIAGPYLSKITDLLNFGLDYRLRMLFFTFDYRLQEDRIKGLPRYQQQMVYFKVVRPF